MDTKDKPLVNRVAQSSLITINLEEFFPKTPIESFDIKPYLFKELILKEKDFRSSMKELDFSIYNDKNVCIFCSSDAIIPVWAFMLVATYLEPQNAIIYFGTKEEFIKQSYLEVLSKLDFEQYTDKRIIVKGCSNLPVPVTAYFELTKRLRPYAKSIMYGEPCSTVPLFKKPRV